MITLVERDLEAFFRAGLNAYGPQAPYVSPMRGDLARFLDARQNPLFAADADFTWFAALRQGRPVGRITAHVHRASNALHGTNRACFGFFDCAEDAGAAAALLAAAEGWARERGFAELCGNFNLTAMQQAGIMTGGFDHAPYTDQIWGAPWLPGFLEAAGFRAHFPMTTFEIALAEVDPGRLAPPERLAALAAEGFAFMPVSRRTLDARLEESRLILNTAFVDNPMFVPLSAEEYRFQAKELKWVLDPRLSTVVRHQGRPAGAIIVIPDLNPLVRATGARIGLATPWHYLRYRLNRRRAVIVFQGVLPGFQNRGLNPAMLGRCMAALKAAGYERLGGTWIADVNAASLRQAEKAGARPLHRLHLYAKALG